MRLNNNGMYYSPSPQHQSRERGAVVLEYVFALIFLFFLLIVFMEFAGIMLLHERLAFAAFAGGRVKQITADNDKSRPDLKAAKRLGVNIVEQGKIGDNTRYTYTATKKLNLPLDYDNFFGDGLASHTFRASQEFYKLQGSASNVKSDN